MFSHKKTLYVWQLQTLEASKHMSRARLESELPHSRSRDQPFPELKGFLRRWRKVVSETGIKNTDS